MDGTAAAALPFRTDEQVSAALPLITLQLRDNRAIAYPTETVYGIGTGIAHAAIDRMLEVKPRDGTKSFLMLIADASMLAGLRADVPVYGARLMAAFWPGPLTMVFASARARLLHPALVGPRDTIAVRWTSHTGAQRVILAHGEPITSTSANRPGLPPARSVGEIVREWERDVRDGTLLVLDGGDVAAAHTSTVVDCTGTSARLLRAGALDAAVLRRVVPDLAGES